jgi:hypothetical protein
MENELLEQLLDRLEERILSNERRLLALLNCLTPQMHEKIELEKDRMRLREGVEYMVQMQIETDRGVKNTQETPIIGWSQKDAEYVYWRDIAYPNLVRMRDEGKIKWFKKVKKV